MESKMLNVRLPAAMAADIEAESLQRGVSKSTVVRERIEKGSERKGSALALVADLIGPIEGLPTDLSSRTKHYLRTTGYGKAKRANYGKPHR
jgi:hypothetical protein